MCAVVFALGVVAAVVAACDSKRSPSLVEAIRDGKVSGDNVTAIEFLQFDVRGGWPFSPADYARLRASKIGSAELVRKLLRLLDDGSVCELPALEAHPTSKYFGIVPYVGAGADRILFGTTAITITAPTP